MRRRGLRITAARRAEVRVLCEATEPLSVQQLYRRVHQQVRADPSTTYRFVNELVEAGLLKAVQLPGLSVPGYALHRPGSGEDFVCCKDCGSLTWLKDLEEIRALEQRLARELHFKGLSHQLRLLGRCEPCQKAHKSDLTTPSTDACQSTPKQGSPSSNGGVSSRRRSRPTQANS